MTSETDPTKNPDPGPTPSVERQFVGTSSLPPQISADAGNPPTSQQPADARPTPQQAPQAGNSQSANADEQLIQQTKIQIRTLVNEIQQLAQSDCSVEEFYDGFLSRVTSALASMGGAIWRVNDNGRLELQFQINLSQTELAGDEKAQLSHDLLLRKITNSNEPVLVQPNSGAGGSDDAGNPTSSLLVIERLVVDQKVVGLVEVFQRPGSGPTTQRGYLRFLVQMCEIASDFLKNRKIRTYQEQQELWEKLEQFIRASHHGLDPKQTAYTIVNEGRRLVDCDRVSYAKKEGRKYTIEVVSGLDSIDRRADEIKKLGALATSVVKGEKELWYNGDTESLPPQIEKKLHDYVDRSHSKVVCVIPLRETQKNDIVEDPEPDKNNTKKDILGALIFERLGDTRIDNSFKKRVEVVSAHACDSLTNSIKHNSIFLMPLWQTIGRTKVFSQSALPRWAIVLSILAIVTSLLCFLPWNFELSADGKLIPVTRFEIYSPYDGQVDLGLTPNADGEYFVDANQAFARIRSIDLQAELTKVESDLTLERTSYQGKINERKNNSDLTDAENAKLAQEIQAAAARYNGLLAERTLLKTKIEGLNVASNGSGRIVDWQIENKLQDRQVSRGEHLMTIVDEEGEWEIELEMLEKKFGHLANARAELKGQKVTFVLSSLPNEKFTGEVRSIDQKADVRSEKGNVILVKVKIDKEDVPESLRLYGATVSARIYCGERPLGYVLFREVYETLQRNVFFWF